MAASWQAAGELARVWRWIAAVSGPVVLVYLTTGHPVLSGATVRGWESNEILCLHLALVATITVLGLLFARSRPALVAWLTLGLSAAFPILEREPILVSLSYLAGGLFLLAAPDRRLFRPVTAVWIGLASVGVLGIATILAGQTDPRIGPLVAVCLVAWGTLLTALRVHKERGPAITEPLLLSALLGATYLGLTIQADSKAFGPAGFHLLALVMTLPALVCLLITSFRLAYIDELTEIPGRRALVEALDDPGPVFTLAMLDVDHFKKFNDTHGHEVGDQVLRMVAARISSVGLGGSAYRYGGEEFTLLFPGKPLDQVAEELERIRRLVESSPLVLRSHDRPKEKPRKSAVASAKGKKRPASVGVTVSIGAATRRPAETWDKVMKRADQALYKAKENGRNQVSQAS